MLKRNISLVTMMLFTEQLASMLSAQLPIYQVLDSLTQETLDKRFRVILDDIIGRIERGQDFGNTLEYYPEAFDSVYVSMVRAGMSSGKLDVSLEILAAYLKQKQETEGKVLSAFSYPIFLIVAMISLITMMIKMVLPNFQKIYASFGQKLPRPTQILLSFAEFMNKWGIYIIISAGAAFFIWVMYINTPFGRLWWDKVKIKLPFIGQLLRRMAFSHFLHTMAALMRSDVPILQALRIGATATGNYFIESIILDASDLVERGRSLSMALRETGNFPVIVLQMISSGEEGGSLDRLLSSAASYYDKQVEIKVTTLFSLLNPALTIIIGLVIAGIMISLFLPIFSMGTVVHG
ncbi:MAG: type II secretion system F family protein [Nitrospirae bacterium]|nr:type II secretion system F family protein [Nitrospirota bacterium]